ncbi:MAG: hypothetical protein PHU99_10510 [Candidatus Cloacimonetes bacterium]|nr:hypothetical protein [Candidatus Cloacimonadota bacterium]
MFKHILVVVVILLGIYAVFLSATSLREFALDSQRIVEASGLARSLANPALLYTHNDSGGENAIFAIDLHGRLKAKLCIEGVTNRDWEEIATGLDPITGTPHIYIGEIGDNGARYPSVAIYRVPEPSLIPGDTLVVCSDYETLNIQYEDGARDAEAMFVDPKTGDIYIISKREEQVGIYKVAYPQSTTAMNIAKKLGTMRMSWVTAADISANGKYILVKNYTSIRRFKVNRKKGIAQALSQKGKNMPYKLEPQGEAICFDAKGKGYFTLSEAAENTPQTLYYYK